MGLVVFSDVFDLLYLYCVPYNKDTRTQEDTHKHKVHKIEVLLLFFAHRSLSAGLFGPFYVLRIIEVLWYIS